MVDQQQLLEQLGPSFTRSVIERLFHFAFVPAGVIQRLADEALHEEWGNENFVLLKYLAVHVAWAIEQGHYTQSGDQIYMSAGHLQTRWGTPLYLIFEPNRVVARQPWALVFAGHRVSAPHLPIPAMIPPPPVIRKGAEIVMSHDHILVDNAERLSFMSGTPVVAQICAVSGAIQWSLNRGLQIPYWYFGRMNFIVPLYLKTRENIAQTPDLVAPIEVSEDTLLVRTVLPPHAPYPHARVAVKRHDQLPAWMLDCWNRESSKLGQDRLEDLETPR